MLMTGQELVASLQGKVHEISVDKLNIIIQDDPQTLLIDIREKHETDVGYARDAILIPRGVLEMQLNNNAIINERIASLTLTALQPIYLICRSGARSVLAAHSLQQMGFSDVYSVAGGFLAWQAAKYPCAVDSQ
ncbi:rhodanese-like domain-containing protein [Psychromonas sp. MME2]|uniref:rhodanese-like domain-containing protein n=1 Tax=unclassified Psychromonas TaxID=2614957 RepID=UPI00339D0D4B